jgi:hypothetical protein
VREVSGDSIDVHVLLVEARAALDERTIEHLTHCSEQFSHPAA